MTIDKNIFIKNVYYMLAYAFQELRRNNYDEIAGEDFDNIYQLFAEILSIGISHQLKQGLHRNYVKNHDDLTTLRGKLDINGTIANRLRKKMTLSCVYDEFSENTLFNQIVKTTANLLIHRNDVREEQRQVLRRLMLYFSNVQIIDAKTIRWGALRFDRNSHTYQMLLNICYFVISEMLLTTEDGHFKMYGFSDDNMNRLFEKFVLAYYGREHPDLRPSARQIDWDINLPLSDISKLPVMQTDVFLESARRILIIDTKYYGHILQEQYGKGTVRSAHLYQIFAYVNNYDRDHTGNVDGMLLYAKTNEDIIPDERITFNKGNIISVRTIDLNSDFEQIKSQLDMFVKTYE